MTHTEEQELLQLTRENNQLLKFILRLVWHDGGDDFMTNVVANLLSNRIDGGLTYARPSCIQTKI